MNGMKKQSDELLFLGAKKETNAQGETRLQETKKKKKKKKKEKGKMKRLEL
jgi:hypothetical protein